MSSNKLAWTWRVKEECLEEYVAMHLNPWPEILEEHSKAGISNYSIFQNGNQFFTVMSVRIVRRLLITLPKVMPATAGMRLPLRWLKGHLISMMRCLCSPYVKCSI